MCLMRNSWIKISFEIVFLTEVHLVHFQEPEVFNYSTLLLNEDKDILYVGAREVIFALNSQNISEKKHEVGMPFLMFPIYMSAYS